VSNGAASLLSEIYAKTTHAGRVVALRTGRKLSDARNLPIAPGFFDQYPRFFETSETTAFANRLNQRHRACIEANKPAIQGKRVLDIASHDGRWSFAALKAGASRVVGIEARDHLVEGANSNPRKYGASENTFRFILGDAFGLIDKIELGSIDTVFCFGFFYHVTDHMLLLSKIERLKPQHIIIDTAVIADPRPIVLFSAKTITTRATAPDREI
jgi:2-polyprenyl-3-methyl-5-hydroxy-6-metoxy-1,4-benzoquinol methylase